MVICRFNQLKTAFDVNQYMASEGPLEAACNHRPHGWQWDHTCSGTPMRMKSSAVLTGASS